MLCLFCPYVFKFHGTFFKPWMTRKRERDRGVAGWCNPGVSTDSPSGCYLGLADVFTAGTMSLADCVCVLSDVTSPKQLAAVTKSSSRTSFFSLLCKSLN